MTSTTGQGTAAQELVAWFAEAWRDPTYESFCRHVAPRLAPDARMVQPMMKPHRGRDEFCRNIATLFAAMPDVHAHVLDWRGDERAVFIEFHLEGTVGSRPVRLHVCDRFSQEEGVVTERHSCFDPAPLIFAVLRSPRALLALPTLRRRARSLYETAFPAGFTTSHVPPNSTTL
ncbi:MAG: nuclear transport factor 2 family protein [Solirubrobacterales bacterium]